MKPYDVVTMLALHHVRVTPKTVWSFIELVLADGSRGWGEATLMRATQDLGAPAAAAREALLGAPLEVVDRYVAAQGIAPLAHAAIGSALEQAAWDVRARQAGCSAMALHGAPARFSVQPGAVTVYVP